MNMREMSEKLNTLAADLEAGSDPASVARSARAVARGLRPADVTVTARELWDMSALNIDRLADRASEGRAAVTVEGLDRETLERAWLEMDILGEERPEDVMRHGFKGLNQRADIELVADLARADRLDPVLENALAGKPGPG